MQRWLFAAALAVLVVASACVSDTKKAEPAGSATPAPVGATPTPAVPPSVRMVPMNTSILDCPVDRELCDFAIQAETWVRNGDVRSLIVPGSGWDTPNDLSILLGSIQGSLPVVARPASLVSIGCPLVNEAGDCSGAFSLTFSTLTSRERDYRGVLTLGFVRRPGAMPALSSVGGPDGDDRYKATASGGTSASCGLSGATPKTETDCLKTVFNVVKVERSTPPGSPPECPLLPSLCQFALNTEASLAAKDYAAVGGSEMQATLAETISSVLGRTKPRLVSIACPFGPTQVWCTGPFALGFTTVDPSADWTTTGGILVLQFEQEGGTTRLAKIAPISDPAVRQAVLFGDIAGGACDLAGRSPATPPGQGPCSGPAFFERYWSKEALPAQQLPSPVVLTAGQPQPPPPNSALYVATGCWACDGPDETLQRHIVDSSGNVTTTTLLENGEGPLAGWTLDDVVGTPDGRLLAAKVCDAAYCGPMGSEVPIATHRVIWSTDGGVTWTEAWRARAFRAFILSVASSGVIVEYITGSPGNPVWNYAVVTPTGTRELKRPSQLDYQALPILLEDGSAIWIPWGPDGLLVGKLLAEDGTPLPIWLPAGTSAVRGGALPGGKLWLSFNQPLPAGPTFAVFDLSGKLYESFRLRDFFHLSLLSEGLAIGNMSTPGAGVLQSSPMFIADLSKGSPKVQVIGAPFGEPPLTGRNTFVAYQRGPFALVNTPGDCLNLRETFGTSGKLLTCLADGSLLLLRPNPPVDPGPPDYPSWQLVETVGGQSGWVRKEFLQLVNSQTGTGVR